MSTRNLIEVPIDGREIWIAVDSITAIERIDANTANITTSIVGAFAGQGSSTDTRTVQIQVTKPGLWDLLTDTIDDATLMVMDSATVLTT